MPTKREVQMSYEQEPLFVPEGKLVSSNRSFAIGQQLVYSFCEWSSLEWKIFSLVVSQLNDMDLSPEEIADTEVSYRAVELPVYVIAKTLGIAKSNAVRDIKNAVMKLRQKAICKVVKDIDGEYKVDAAACIKVEIGDGQNFITMHYINGRNTKVVKLIFNGELKPYISSMNSSFFKDNINIIIDFKSVYALRMYILLMHVLKRTGDASQTLARTYKLDALRLYLGVRENEYKRFYDFKRRVLDPALEEISSKKLLDVSLSIIYDEDNHGEVDAITFKYCMLLPEARTAADVAVRKPNEKAEFSLALGKELALLDKDKDLVARWCKKGYKKSGICKLVSLYGHENVRKAFDAVEPCLDRSRSGFLVVKAFCEAQKEGGGEQ